jgi:hypothetical protein
LGNQQSFYGFLTLHEINDVIVDHVERHGLLLVTRKWDQQNRISNLLDLSERIEPETIERAYIACDDGPFDSSGETDPPPCIVLDVPKPRAANLGQTWIAYKIHDQYLHTDCANKVISCFRAVTASVRRRLIGLTLAYFPNDRDHLSIYKNIKYSKDALESFKQGSGWRQGGTMFEPVLAE